MFMRKDQTARRDSDRYAKIARSQGANGRAKVSTKSSKGKLKLVKGQGRASLGQLPRSRTQTTGAPSRRTA